MATREEIYAALQSEQRPRIAFYQDPQGRWYAKTDGAVPDDVSAGINALIEILAKG